MTVLDQIIEDALEGSLSGLLRKLLVLSHRVGSEDLKKWVSSELNGYEADSVLPKYRGPMTVPVQATYAGPMGSSASNMPLSPVGVPDEYRFLFEVSFYDPIATIEALSEGDSGASSSWDPVAVGMYNQWAEEGRVAYLEMMSVVGARRVFSLPLVRGVIDQVRTQALELALEIQAEFPDAGEKDGPTVENPDLNQTVTHVTNNIYGNVGNLAQGQDIRQEVTVEVGNLEAAISAAAKVLNSEVLDDFKKLLVSEEPQTEKRNRVSVFIDSVRQGSVALVAGTLANVGADRLLEIASQYFGW